MFRIRLIAALATLLGLTGLFAGAAHALQRTHVSAAFGADANTASNCSATAPCRFFQAALTVTDTNGEVVVLDNGGYGAVTITQSVSLVAPTGVYAGISVFPGAEGVTIATPGVKVVLRGLTINGQGGDYGIHMTAGASLSVEDCVVANMAADGIVVTAPAVVSVVGTLLRGNPVGIFAANGASATLSKVTVLGSTNTGIQIYGNTASTTTATITDSVVSGSGTWGIIALSNAASANVRASVIRSTVTKTASTGVSSQSTAGGLVVLTLSESLVTANAFALQQFGTGATLETLGNNTVRQNTAATSGTITAVAPM